MLLAALSSPVPVIVRSMTPEVVKSLPPVAVRSMPGPDLVTGIGIVAALLAAVFSGIAIVIAVKTLKKIDRQINLAKEELKAVKDDFGLSEDQFILSQKQFAELMRRPKLSVDIWQIRETELATLPDRSRPKIVTLLAAVWNNGDAVARHILLELFLPTAALVNMTGIVWVEAGIKVEMKTASRSNEPSEEGPCDVFDFYGNDNGQSAVYTKGHYVRFEGSFALIPNCEELTVLWRVFDQYGVYPGGNEESDNFGRCKLVIKPRS